jgi:hypothetical protein
MSLISMIPLELRKRRIEQAVLTQFGDHLDDAALRTGDHYSTLTSISESH